jgi:hypothetical protein
MYNLVHMCIPRCRLLAFVASLAVAACAAQDRSDWQSVAKVQPGTKVRLSLKSHQTVTDDFKGSTAEQVTVGTVVAKREDVQKLERYRSGGWGRGKTAVIGALIGGGAGAAIGAAAGGCHTGDFICFSRGTVGAILGAVGAIIGAGVGALIPPRRTEVVYAAR